jgi:hypothetical protein
MGDSKVTCHRLSAKEMVKNQWREVLRAEFGTIGLRILDQLHWQAQYSYAQGARILRQAMEAAQVSREILEDMDKKQWDALNAMLILAKNEFPEPPQNAVLATPADEAKIGEIREQVRQALANGEFDEL